MKKNVFSIFSVLSVLAFLVTGLFTSCEVGLGEAVDTYPPTLTLDYPANDGITVMNTFQMRGEAKDETYVKTVDVIVKTIPKSNKETAKELIRYAAEIDSQAKTWSCAVNQKDENGTFQIPDGEYTFQIICTDSSDRTTELSRVYKIDNTAPVVVLKRPGLDDSYGRTIKVTGDISDENELSALYFTAYRNKGTEEAPDFELIGTQRYENISGVGLELIVGRYFESEEGLSDNEKNQKAIYDAYYDSTIGGSQSFYCMVEVADSAKEYTGTLDLNAIPSGASADSLKPAAGSYTGEVSGNLSTCYYLYDDIYDDIFSKDGFYINNSDLVSIFNGSFTETSSVTIAKVKDTLENYAIKTSAVSKDVSMFTLNPDNSPYFNASGFEKTKASSLTKGGLVTVMVYQGRDQIALRTKTIRLALDRCDSNGVLTYQDEAQRKANEIVLIESKAKIDELTSSSDVKDKTKGASLLAIWKEYFESGDFVKMSIPASGTSAYGDTYKTGNYYRVRVDGEDLEGNYIESYGDQIYMFKFQNGQAPILNVTGGTEDNSVQKTPYDFSSSRTIPVSDSPVFTYSGTLKSDSGIEDLSVFYYITVKDEKGTKSWSTQKESLKDRKATLSESADDVEIPFVWELSLSEDSEDFAELYQKAQADGKDLSDGLYLYTIYFYAYDGSQTTATVSQRVHVDTKKPEAVISNVSPKIVFETEDDLPYSDMTTGTEYVNGSVTVTGTVSDNYTLNKTTVSAYLLDSEGKKTSTSPFASQEFGDSMSYSFTMDTSSVTEPSDLLIEVQAEDKAGNLAELVTKTVRIDQRTDEPRFLPSNVKKNIQDVSKLNEDTNMLGKSSNNKITGTVTDDDGVFGWEAYYSTNGGTSWSATPFDKSTKIYDSVSANISVNLAAIPSFDEGVYKIKIIVKDIAKGGGNVQGTQVTSSEEFYVAIDDSVPVISVPTNVPYVSGNEGATVSGRLSDGSKEIKSFTRSTYRIVTDNEGNKTETLIGQADVNILNILSATSGDSVKNGVDFVDHVELNGEENPGKVVYKAIDKYGRESEAIFNYIIDNEKPSVLISDKIASEIYLAKSSASMAIEGTASDLIDRVSKVEYAVVDFGTAATAIAAGDWKSFSGAEKWNSTLSFGSIEGKKTVYVRAVDAAGNYTAPANYDSRTVIIDGAAPVIKITSVKDTNGTRTVSAEDGVYYVQNAYVITGTVKDDYLDKLKVGDSEITITPAAGQDGLYSFTYTVNSPVDGQDSFTLNATDLAGQLKSEKLSIYCDTEDPKPSISLSPTVSANGKENNINGTVTIRGTATDNDKIKESIIYVVDENDQVVFERPASSATNFTSQVPISFAINGGTIEVAGEPLELESGIIQDKHAYKTYLVSTDRSGRSATSAIFNFFVDLDTDKPVINLSNTSASVDTADDVSAESNHNLFNQTTNNKLLGTITDDDGISSVLVEYALVNSNGSEGTYQTLLSASNLGTSYNLAVTLATNGTALAEGIYKIRISVSDTTENADDHKAVEEFYIGIDNGAPILNIVTSNNAWQQATFDVVGNVSDAALKSIKRYKTSDNSTPEGDALAVWEEGAASNTITYNEVSGAWTDNITGVTATGSVLYIAEDKFGQQTKSAFTYLFDADKPTTAPDWIASDMSPWSNNTAQKFSVPLSDSYVDLHDGNGLKAQDSEKVAGNLTVSIQVDSEPATSMVIGSQYFDSNDIRYDGAYFWYNSTLLLEDGNHTVKIAAEDSARNKNENAATYTLNIDTVAPVFTAYAADKYVDASDTNLTGADVANLANVPFTLKVTTSDATSGVKAFQIYDGSTNVTENVTLAGGQLSGSGAQALFIPASGTTFANGSEYTFSLSASLITTGTHTFYVKAIDQAGNSEQKGQQVSVDVTPPTLSFNDPSPYVTVSGNRKYNGKVTISGKITDENGKLGTSEAIKYEVLDQNGAALSPAVKGSVDLNGGLSEDWSFEIDTTRLTTGSGTFKIKVTGYDAVENFADNSASFAGGKLILNVDQTTDKPAVKLSNASVNITAENMISSASGGNLFGMGNDSIFASATDDDGISSIVLKINGTEVKNLTDNTKPYFDVSDKPTSYAMEIDLTKILPVVSGSVDKYAGTYRISLEVTDTSSGLTSSTYTVNNDSVNNVYFAYDDDLPTIEITKINENNYSDGMWATIDSNVFITVGDSSSADNHTGLTVTNESIMYWDENNRVYALCDPEAGEASQIVWDNTASAFKHVTKNADKTYKRKYKVSDKYGRSATKEISYVVDTVDPVFDSDYLALFGSSPDIDNSVSASDGVPIATASAYWFNSDAVKVIGRGSESGQALVESHPESVKLVVGENETPVNPGTYNRFSSTITFDEGQNTLVFNATDKAGANALPVSTTVNVDTIAPNLSDVEVSDNFINGEEKAALSSRPFYIKVTASDANGTKAVSGIGSFKVLRGTDDITDKTTIRTGSASSSTVAAKTNGKYADGTYYIHLAEDAITTGEFTFYVKATDLAGNTRDVSTEIVKIDVSSPEMSWNVPSPYVTVSSARKYNGIITVSGTVNDETNLSDDDEEEAASEETRSVNWEVKNSAGASLASPVKGFAALGGTKTSGFSFTLDTTRLTTGSGDFRIYISARDEVGNKVSVTKDGKNYIEISVDQATDKPTVRLSNASSDIKTEGGISSAAGGNLFGMGSNSIFGSVSDDDGIASIVLKIDGNVVNNPNDNTKPYFDVSGNPTSYTMEIDLTNINPGEEKVIASGSHTLSIEVTDIANASAISSKTYTTNTDSVNGVYFAYDDDLPTISVVKCNDKDYTNYMWGKAAFEVYIRVSDATDTDDGENLTLTCTDIKKSADGSTAASYSPYTPASAENIVWSPSATIGSGESQETIEKTWKCSTVNEEGYFQRTYEVSDKYGRSTTTTINYVVDSTAPVFNAKYITVQGTSNLGTSAINVGNLTDTTWFNNSAIKIAGTGSSYTGNDTAIKEQNMESLVITVTGNETPDYNVNTSTNNKFTSTIEFGEGSAKSFYLTATDKAGNTTTSGTWAINVDTAKPTDVSGTLKKADGSAVIADDSTINYTSVLLSLAAKDTTSGVKTIYIGKTPGFLTSAAIKTIELDSAISTAAGYSGDITLDIGDNTKDEYLADGTYSLYVRVKDLAGNITDGDTALASFTVDRTPPAVTITSPVRTSVIDNDWVISGTVEDNNFVESGSIPELWVYKSGSWVEINTANGYGSGTTSDPSRNGNSWSIKLDSTKIDDASSHTTDAFLAVRITDKAGNVTALPTGTPATDDESYYYLTVNQDNDRPVIKFTEVSGDGSSAETTYLVKYATYIKGTVTDADGNAITGTNATVFKVSPTAITTAEGWEAFVNETSGNSLTNGKVERKASGDFTYTPADGEDGPHTVYFYYKDSKGTEFWTGHTNPLNRPYVVWADTEANVDNNSVITYRTDKSRPELDAIVCGTGSTKEEAELNALINMYGENGIASEMGTTTVAGGSERKFIAFAVKASDNNGIKKVSYVNPVTSTSVELTVTSKKYLNIETNEAAGAVANDTDTVKIVEAYFFDGIDISNLCPSSGDPRSETVTISAQDSSELDNDKQKNMLFTCVGPEIAVTSPILTDTVSAGNKNIFQGTVESNANGIQNASLKYIYVNNKVYDALDSAGASGRSSSTSTTGYTFPTSVSTEAKIAYIEAQALSPTEGHPKVHVAADENDSSWDAAATVTRFKWDISTAFPSEDSGAPEISYVPHNAYGIYNLPLWILATDTLGNKTLLEYTIKYNPFGDRPTAQVTYPEEKSEDEQYAVISGTIRVSGSAQDNISVDSVYLQIDANKDGDFDENDANILITAGYSVYGTSAAKTAINSNSVTVLTGNFDADTKFWGIKATGSQSWYTSLNSKGEFQNDSTKVLKEGTSEVNYYKVKVRAAALDNNNKLGAWTNALEIHIDPNAPAIGKNVKAYVLDASSIKHEMTADMWVKGETYLCVSVQHAGGLTALSYQSSDDQSTINTAPNISLVDNSAVVTANAAITGTLISNWSSHPDFVGSDAGGIASDQGYFLKIPLNTESGEGNRVIKISATTENNGVPLTSEDIYTFKYDNIAPAIGDLKVNESETWGSESLALQNSNNKLSLKGDVQDDKSGFNFALWYFYRDKVNAEGRNRRVYDPSIKYTTSDWSSTGAMVQVTTDAETPAVASGITEMEISGQPVYGKTLTVTRNGGSGTLTLPAADTHITNGSAVYMNGEWLFLSGSTDNLTFNLSSNVATSVTSAFFPYAKVTSYLTPRENAKNWNEDGEEIEKDDGDKIIEGYDLSGTTATWSAAFHGDYIPDGSIGFVYVAFDKSGNSAAVAKTGKVQNKPPRLAKLHLATDLNGDEYFADAEFESYNILGKTGDYQSDYDLATTNYGLSAEDLAAGSSRPAFIIKDTLGVVPEFTGGNGDIALVYKRGDTTASGSGTRGVKTSGGDGTISTVTANYKAGNTTFTDTTAKWLYKLTNANLTGKDSPTDSDDGSGKHLSFTFWDSTEECTQGIDSQSCYVQLTDLTVDVTDGVAPKVVIEPFFWSGKGFEKQTLSGSTVYVPNNNLYYTFSEGAPTDTVNGHIELEGDLPKTTDDPAGVFDASSESGEYDTDPKVSGKIVVRGTAYDDVRINSLWVSFDDFTIGGNLTNLVSIKGQGTETTVTDATGSYSYTTARGGDGKTYYLAAIFDGSSWTTVDDMMDSNYWGFNIVEDGVNDKVEKQSAERAFFDQRGHRVHWELYLDTSHLTNVAGLDKSIRVLAVDARGQLPSSITASTGDASLVYNQANKPSYKVDVVPYVTKINRNTTYNTNRARSGATPLLRGETLNSVEGFNLGKATGSTIAITLNTTADGTGTAYAMTSPAVVTAGKKLSFTMPATAKDGYMTVSIDGIKTLNNLNKDSLAYNKENTENVSSTDYWTDTRYVHVWQSNTTDYFAGSTLPIYPSMAMGTSGTLYASFSNYSASSVYYSTIGGTAQQVFYGYDPPEETDICVSGTGTVNVVYNANYHGGSEASWAADSNSCGGLYMYDKNAASAYVGRDDRQILRFELFYHNRMLQQFKNMRVKRADSADTGIVHVAYYDRTTSSIHYSEVKSNYSYTIVNNRNTGWEDYSYNEISWVNIDGGKDTDDDKYHNGSSSTTYNDQIKSVSLTDARFEDETKRCTGTGESVGLALTQTNHYPVVVYYDASNMILKLARATSETPKGNVSYWSVQEVLSTTDDNYKTMVDYIACDIDTSGYLHIVFQNSKGQLCYIKSTNTSANGATKYTFDSSVVIADSATNIDLTLKGTVPYVSYLTKINSFDGMNIAFLDSTLDLNCDGTAEGGWETMTAPLNYKVSNVKSCIEAHPTPASAAWEAAVGFTPGDLYRVAYYVGNGSGH